MSGTHRDVVVTVSFRFELPSKVEKNFKQDADRFVSRGKSCYLLCISIDRADSTDAGARRFHKYVGADARLDKYVPCRSAAAIGSTLHERASAFSARRCD